MGGTLEKQALEQNNDYPEITQNGKHNKNHKIQSYKTIAPSKEGLNQIMNLRNQNADAKTEPTPPPEKLRTIDLSNYQRLD